MTEHLTQTIDIETPELVVISYTIAKLESRITASLIDLIICIVGFLAVILGLALVTPDGNSAERAMSTSLAIAITVLLQFVVLWGYYLLFEGLGGGQTP